MVSALSILEIEDRKKVERRAERDEDSRDWSQSSSATSERSLPPRWGTCECDRGGDFIFDRPETTPAVWGAGNEVLWAEGEALMIVGPTGIGKTTLVGLLLKGLLGFEAEVLGFPVKSFDKVVYFAMDRPEQIGRALKRIFEGQDREALNDKLTVWKGPPASDPLTDFIGLSRLLEAVRPGVVILDSLKDFVIGLSTDEAGAGYNRVRQGLLQAGIQLVEVHHCSKGGLKGLDDAYGSTWLVAGCGSVVGLDGSAGSPRIILRHLKAPASQVAPLKLTHDQSAGRFVVDHPPRDLVAIVAAAGPGGVTVKQVAGSNERGVVETTRGMLNRLVEAGKLTKVDGQRGGGRSRRETIYSVPAPGQSASSEFSL